MIEAVHFCLCALFASYMVCCNKISWNSSIDVIRIQNNRSKIRTVFLPKISANSIFEAHNLQTMYKRSNKTSDQLISTDHNNTSNIKSPSNKNNSTTQKWKLIKEFESTNHNRNENTLNYSESSKNTLKWKKEETTNNRSFNMWFDAQSHLRNNANKIGKCKYTYFVIMYSVQALGIVV